MQKLKGSVTISQQQMQDCVDTEDIMLLFRAKGVPLNTSNFNKLQPHPDYIYTDSVDYACHAITITWELKS